MSVGSPRYLFRKNRERSVRNFVDFERGVYDCLRGNAARIHVFLNRYALCKLNVSEFISTLSGLNMPKNEASKIIC